MMKVETPRLHPEWIDSHAYGIVNALQKNGFTTYLVGGCVRDLLLGKIPKDFDIATEATPNEVRKIIHKAYVIGKRFRLVLVKRGELQFEVATFRRNMKIDETKEDVGGDNFWGTPEQDSFRRDFTVNGLFYDPVNNHVIDHVDGGDDLRNGVVRMIGEPNERLIEDPIRILRAIRLSHLVNFAIERSLKKAIIKNAETLADSALPRRREEVLKFLRIDDPNMPFLECFDLGVLKVISPTLQKIYEDEEKSEVFSRYLMNLHDFKTESPVELFAGLVLGYVRAVIQPDASLPIKANDLLEDDGLLALMKDELGMFKYEQISVAKAIQSLSTLISTEEYEKKSSQRQFNVLKAESFPLALKLAESDYLLSSEVLGFWKNQYQKSLPKIREFHKSRQATKGRRRPKKGEKRPARALNVDE